MLGRKHGYEVYTYAYQGHTVPGRYIIKSLTATYKIILYFKKALK